MIEHPAVFVGDLLDDGPVEVVREDAPSVGFDLEMPAKVRVLAPVGEEVADVVLGGAQGATRFGVERDVEVDAACGRRYQFIVIGYQVFSHYCGMDNILSF